MKKAWQYDVRNIGAHRLAGVEEHLELFTLKAKGLRFMLRYEDLLVGRVSIDGDADMQASLCLLRKAAWHSEHCMWSA